MNRKYKNLALFFAAVILSGVVLWQFVNREKNEFSSVWEQQFMDLKADLTIEGVDYRRITPEGQSWEVRADVVRLYENQSRMDLDHPVITFFDHDSKNITVTSETGSYQRGKGLFSVEKHVIVRFKNGERLYADILNYDQAKDLIWSDMPVVLKRDDGLVVNARSMRYQTSKGVLILKDQESVIPVSANEIS